METEFKTIKQDIGVEAHETFKLEKNTKGYNWEIKIFVSNGDKETIERLEKINNELIAKFGNVENGR
jgi:hypothetical protein